MALTPCVCRSGPNMLPMNGCLFVCSVAGVRSSAKPYHWRAGMRLDKAGNYGDLKSIHLPDDEPRGVGGEQL